MTTSGVNCRAIISSVTRTLPCTRVSNLWVRAKSFARNAVTALSSPPIWRSSCEQGIERVIIAGVKTNVCIRATVQDAFANGLSVVVPREATNSNRAASLEDIERYFGDVVPLDAALEMLA